MLLSFVTVVGRFVVSLSSAQDLGKDRCGISYWCHALLFILLDDRVAGEFQQETRLPKLFPIGHSLVAVSIS